MDTDVTIDGITEDDWFFSPMTINGMTPMQRIALRIQAMEEEVYNGTTATLIAAVEAANGNSFGTDTGGLGTGP